MDNWVLNSPLESWPTYGAAKFPFLFRFFETSQTVVVLANSNKLEQEVNIDNCETDAVPILRRKGGGGTVVLGPGCVVLTLAFFANDLFSNSKYFHLINGAWIAALQDMGVNGLHQKGISDIAFGEKKVAGTSIFRKKNLLVYQGSLLVNGDQKKISRYLKHPSKEPDYREGRTHKDFLTDISEASQVQHNAKKVADYCAAWFEKNLFEILKHDALALNEAQKVRPQFESTFPF